MKILLLLLILIIRLYGTKRNMNFISLIIKNIFRVVILQRLATKNRKRFIFFS